MLSCTSIQFTVGPPCSPLRRVSSKCLNQTKKGPFQNAASLFRKCGYSTFIELALYSERFVCVKLKDVTKNVLLHIISVLQKCTLRRECSHLRIQVQSRINYPLICYNLLYLLLTCKTLYSIPISYKTMGMLMNMIFFRVCNVNEFK